MNTLPTSAENATLFKDPSTGLLHSIDKAWLWALLFGPLYFLVKRAWLHAAIFFVFSIFIPGFLNVVYAFIAQNLLRDLYTKNGWIPQDRSVLETTQLVPPIAILLGKKRSTRYGTSSTGSAQNPAESKSPGSGATSPKPKPTAPPRPSYTPSPVSQSSMTSESQRNLVFNIVFVIGAIIIIAMTFLDIEFSSLLAQLKSLLQNN